MRLEELSTRLRTIPGRLILKESAALAEYRLTRHLPRGE